MKYTAPRGTRDILPAEMPKWKYVEQKFESVCHRYGFQEIRLPTFEATEVFTRGVGDSTDIVRKEMYTFLDKSQRSMTLRPEGTAGVVRSFVEQGMQAQAFPVRLFYNLNLFRYERVAKGRYREFHQLGVEAFGSKGPEMELEILSLLHTFFTELGLRSTKLHLNCIGTASSRADYNRYLREALEPHLPELCGDCHERYDINPMRILDCKVPRCQEVIADLPRLLDRLDEESLKHFEEVKKGLDALGIPYVIDPNMVRGLDYYSKTVFEFVSENVGTQGTICGGGRYDGLVSMMGGNDIPGVGFAMGVERLLMELEAQEVSLPSSPSPDLFLAHFGGDCRLYAQQLAQRLRQLGVKVDLELTERSFKAQMRYADKCATRFLLVIGENEVQQERAKLKNMKTGESREISLKVEDLSECLPLLLGKA